MTDRAEIERLLNQTGRTLEGLPKHYHSDDVHKRIKELTGVWGLWTGMPELGAHILHQSDVIELLVGALRDSEPVIRCKDCKHAVRSKREGILKCEQREYDYSPDDGYCFMGERRGGR